MGVLDWLLRRQPLTAAATQIQPRQLDRPFTQARDVSEAWRVWRCVGEIHYATTQQARLVSRLEWDIELAGDPLEPDQRDEMVSAVFGRQLPELSRLASLHLQVAGAYLLAQGPWGEGGADRWEVMPHPVGYRHKQKLANAKVVTLVNNPDPVDERWSDSPVLAAIDVARELMLARAQARATARSRTAQLQTVLYPLEGVADPDEFEAGLLDVITTPIQDELSTASVAPNIIGFRGDLIEKWKTIDLTGPVDEKLYLKIQSLIRQLAVMLDIPPEVLTGLGETNHWSQWAIQEDNWLGHVEPMAKTIGHGFALALSALAGVEDDQIDMIPDPAPLLKRRPTVGDALSAYDKGLVSGEWARRQIGADEDDAPDESERPSPATQEPDPAEETQEPPQVEEGAVAASGAALTLQVRPDTVRVVNQRGETLAVTAAAWRPDDTRLAEIDQQLLDGLGDLLQMAFTRVSDKIGSQLRSKIQGDPTQRAALADVPNSELARHIPARSLPNYDQTVAETMGPLLDQWFRSLVNRAYRYTRQAGIEIYLPDEVMLNALDLFQSEAAFIVDDHLMGEPTDASIWTLVRRAVTVAGGGQDPAQQPETAASRRRIAIPDPLDYPGVGLGRSAVQWVIDHRGLEPRAYRWEHVGGSKDPHPKHQSFDGLEYDGSILDNGDGIAWFIGDHAGCNCRRLPLWKER